MLNIPAMIRPLILCFTFTSMLNVCNAQFTLLWQKPIGLTRDSLDFQGLSCVQRVDSNFFIGYQVKIHDNVYPGVSYITPQDSLHRLNNFSVNDGLDGYRIIGFVKVSGDTVLAFCNDEKLINGHEVQSPAIMKFSLHNDQLRFEDYYHVNLSDTSGVSHCGVVDAISAGNGAYYLAINFVKNGVSFVNIYFSRNNKVEAVYSDQQAESVKLWWGDESNLVVTTAVPFSTNRSNHYYQVQIFGEQLKLVRTYPETLDYVNSSATDSVISISYRAPWHVGFLARQVRDVSGVNHLGWYGFNGFPAGTYNKLIGEDKNLLIADDVVHPVEEKVVYNYFYPNAGLNNWVVSRLPRKDLLYDNLVLSVENYNGLELARDTFGKATDYIMSNASADPELLKDIGTGDLDKCFEKVLCFSFENGPELYVVQNKPSKSLQKSGIFLSKFSLNTSDERLSPTYLKTRYHADVYTSKKPIAASDARKVSLVAIDNTDPLFERKGLDGEKLTVTSQLTPVTNTWFWEGDVKIGKKKYHLSRAVISLDK